VGEENIKYAQRSKNVSIANASLPFRMIITEHLKEFFGPGPLHTDSWPRLEFSAPRQLHRYDLPSQERMTTGYRLSSKTKEIVEAGNHIDGILDKIEFAASAHAPLLEIPNLQGASASQKERLQDILDLYCTETLVQNYDMFPGQDVKTDCARHQANRIRQHLALKPDDASGYYDLGLALEQMNSMKEAIDSLQKAISLNPYYVNAYNRLGVIMTRQGRLEEALGYFRDVLLIKPGDAVAIQNLEHLSH
jgi:tetratricopeptide (TPR) repeat protein